MEWIATIVAGLVLVVITAPLVMLLLTVFVLVPLAHSRNAPGLGEYNFGGYSNARVDELIDRGRVEFDDAKRKVLFNDAMAAIDAETGFVPLIHRHVIWAMRKTVRTPLGPNDILDLRFVNID